MSETPPPRLPTAIAGDNHDARRRSGPPSLDDLPNELLVEIFSYFSAASTLEPRFRDDASTIMDDYLAARGSSPYHHLHHHLHHHGHSNDSQTHTPLKAISLVCRRWRDVILPRLFRHVLWTFRRLEQPPASGGGEPDDDVERLELLAFLRRNRLGDAVKGITLHVPCPEHLIDDPTELVGRWGLVPDSTAAALISPKDEEGGGQDEDDVGVVLSDSVSLVLADVNGHATWANTWFWALLFRVVTDPLRVSLLAAPVVLATMISRKVFTRCQPQLMTRYHLLSVSRPLPGCQLDHPPPPPAPAPAPGPPADLFLSYPFTPVCDNLPCELFARQPPWTALLANEGSSVSIYKTDGYGDTPPSPLLSLLASRDPATRRDFLCGALRRLEYVAVVPMATHVQVALTSPALVPPHLEELYVQLMPRRRGSSVGDPLDGLDREDVLVERDMAYSALFQGIFVPGPRPEWRSLCVFETGDAEDDELAWEEAVETVLASGSGWEVDGLGRFVRDVPGQEERRRRRRRTGGGGWELASV